MDHSRTGTPFAARRIALAASVAAHALVAGLWWHAPTRKPAPEADRPRAAMTVRIYITPPQMAAALPVHTQVPAQSQAEKPVSPAKPPRIRTVRRTADAEPAPLPAVTVPAPLAPPQPPVSTEIPTPAAVPGAAFSGLFAPIISRPLGRSGWSRRSADPDPAPAPDPQVQREQALLALRMSLLGRLSDLADRLDHSGQRLHCDIAIDGTRQLAEVRCTDPADQGAPWSALQGLLVAGTVPAATASLCLRLAGRQVSAAPCPDEPAPPTP